MTHKTFADLVDKAHESLQYGTVNLTIKKVNGTALVVDTTTISTRKVHGNAQALTIIGSMLKLLKEAEETGNLTFTIQFNKGDANQVMVNDFSRKNYREGGIYV